jgi:hypothetical protein
MILVIHVMINIAAHLLYYGTYYIRFLLIQYPCQKNNIGLTEYWIKHRTNFSAFQSKKLNILILTCILITMK